MRTRLYPATERGHASYGWLEANYSFSFANYYNPSQIHFGALRVLNDDVIQGGTGFGEHPHNDMEIITIPLQGSLKHRDSMSNRWIPLHTGEVQVMSAGKGVRHSEMNNSSTEALNLFQIWIMPDKKDVDPAYGQMHFDPAERRDRLQVLVQGQAETGEGELRIHQDARISRIDMSKDKTFKYDMRSEQHGVYLMLVSGGLQVAGENLGRRDAIGIWETDSFTMRSTEESEVLLIEVPMFL